jgi:WhiB family redox-sensing transcriptional regulator
LFSGNPIWNPEHLVTGPNQDRHRHNDQEVGKDMSELTCQELELPAVPCHGGNPDLWFAESPVELEQAKALCADCPIRSLCLSEALARQEPWGVWGGEIIERGAIVARKRPRGRPRKDTREGQAA